MYQGTDISEFQQVSKKSASGYQQQFFLKCQCPSLFNLVSQYIMTFENVCPPATSSWVLSATAGVYIFQSSLYRGFI